jgi:hypothetical protein
MNKKWIVRAAAVAAVCVASLLIAAPVLAPWGWCDVDPVLNVNGHTVNLDAAIQGDPQVLNNGVDFYVVVPRGTEISVVSCDQGADVTIINAPWRSDSIYVWVCFNTHSNFPAMLTVLVDGQQVSQATGTTNLGLGGSFSVE